MVDTPPGPRPTSDRRANGFPLRPGRLPGLALATLAASWTAAPTAAWAERSCEDWQATFVAVQGERGAVEFRRDEASAWETAFRGAAVCSGYSIRVGAFGDATLRLPDNTVMRLHRNSVMNLDEPDDARGIWVRLWRGLVHIISRDPRALRFTTPYANAGLEGTEFEIEVADGRTDVAVIEGEVLMTNDVGRAAVREGERGSAEAGRPPRTVAMSDRFDGTAWTPFYEPILYLDLPAPGAEPDADDLDDPEYFAARAASRLALGDVAGAQADIAQALHLAPGNATALALGGLLALRRGDKRAALDAAQAAVAANPESVPARIALAHVQQARFEFADARASLLEATRLDPRNALAWALLAELRLSRGSGRGALAAAEEAARLAPNLARVHTVLGFVELARSADAAMRAFRKASELDSGDPLPRIGMATAQLATGNFDAGRAESEIAIILDPRNAQTRSYVAKIYAQERRMELTESQLKLSELLDPADPTPHYYDALAKQAQNRLVEALGARRAATALNGNRAPYRGTFRLDEDLPIRSAGLGQLHRELGFSNLALLEGWKATVDDPTDYSGHRLLADVYSVLPRHEIARVNELYQSELLQPLNVTPIPPQLAEANLFLLDKAGPSELSFSEFTPFVRENGLSFLGSAVSGANGTIGADFVAAGLRDRLSYSAGHFAFKSDGFRENNDIDQRVTNAFVQLRPTRATSVLTELRSSDVEKGDLRMLFDPTAFSPNERQKERVDSLRVGLRHTFSDRGTLAASLIGEHLQDDLSSGPDFALAEGRRTRSLDVQHIHQAARWRLTSGVRHSHSDVDQESHLTVALPFPPFAQEVHEIERFGIDHTTAYVYSNLRWTPKLSATVGVSADFLRTLDRDTEQWNPKLGLLYEPNGRTTLRVSALQTLEGPLISRYNIQPRLEPTHVAGFNQLFYGSEGERSRRVGVAVDHEFSSSLFGGAELSKRNVELATTIVMFGPTTTTLERRDEYLLRSYLYWAPTDRLSVAAEYQFETINGSGDVLVDGVENVRTHRVPLSVNLFTETRLHAGIKATYVDQKGDFSPFARLPNPIIEYGQDSFWVTDLSLGYRLPNRRGSVSLDIDNVLDEDFRFQDTDPENPTLLPERLLVLRFTVAY